MQSRKEWHEKANCKGVSTDNYTVFFPDIGKGDGGNKLKLLYSQALAFCDGCTVKKPCLETQLVHEKETLQFHGVWGGTTPEQRREILSNREWNERLRR